VDDEDRLFKASAHRDAEARAAAETLAKEELRGRQRP
jgi:hypothetical protein